MEDRSRARGPRLVSAREHRAGASPLSFLSSYVPFDPFLFDFQRPRYPLFLRNHPFYRRFATASNTFYHHLLSHDPNDISGSRISYPFEDDLTRLRSYSGIGREKRRYTVYTGFVVSGPIESLSDVCSYRPVIRGLICRFRSFPS